MPYQVRRDRKKRKWIVVKKGSTRPLGTHDTKAEANKQLAALYAQERKNG